MTQVITSPTKSSTPIRVQQDPLDEAESSRLLALTGVIRDPVHGDIRITSLEREIIDTEIVQRLRSIKQLAMVDVVYPGATHTRFLHSVGVLHVVSQMISACNNSAANFARFEDLRDQMDIRPGSKGRQPYLRPLSIGPYAELLARLVALLHDAAHVPFGHVFEREAHVFEKDEWEDDWRQRKVFGADSGLRKKVRAFFRQHISDRNRLAEQAADKVMDEVRAILVAKSIKPVKAGDQKNVGSETVSKLRYPFVYDLVSNTLCADLIDYLKRDTFFCGLPSDIGTRCVDYLGVVPVESSNGEDWTLKPAAAIKTAFPRRTTKGRTDLCRIALLPYRYSNREGALYKRYVIVEAVELVRRRKMLAEAAYFHPTKLCATSMLAMAVTEAGFDSGKDIWECSDEDVIKDLVSRAPPRKPTGDIQRETRKNCRISNLAKNLRRRHFFEPIYYLEYHEDQHSSGELLWDHVYPDFSNPAWRANTVDTLEQIVYAWKSMNGAVDIELIESFGSISISCPHKDMQLKALGMYVIKKPDVRELNTLQEVAEEGWLTDEMGALTRGHHELWGLKVYVNKDVIPKELAEILASAVKSLARGLPNTAMGYKSIPEKAPKDILRDMKKEWFTSRLTKDGLIKKLAVDSLDRLKATKIPSEHLLTKLWEEEYEDFCRKLGAA